MAIAKNDFLWFKKGQEVPDQEVKANGWEEHVGVGEKPKPAVPVKESEKPKGEGKKKASKLFRNN